MTSDSICSTRFQPETDAEERLFDSWFDPIESAVRDRVRSFIEGLIEGELAAVAARPRYGRRAKDSNIVSIHERPKEVEGRTVPGHWESDLIIGPEPQRRLCASHLVNHRLSCEFAQSVTSHAPRTPASWATMTAKAKSRKRGDEGAN